MEDSMNEKGMKSDEWIECGQQNENRTGQDPY